MACRRAAWLLCGLTLAACVGEAKVEVARAGGRIDVTVTRDGDAPCVKSLIVSRDGANAATTPPLWELSTAEGDRCRAAFTYGVVPDGYGQSGAAPPLDAGTTYLVEVSGPGLMGGSRFRPRADDGPMTLP